MLNKQELLELKAKIADKYIDEKCQYDIFETIEELFDWGCTEEELIALGFDINDIQRVLEEKEIDNIVCDAFGNPLTAEEIREAHEEEEFDRKHDEGEI